MVLRPRYPLAIKFALVWAVVCDSATTIPFGPLSASGAATLSAGLLAALALPWILAIRMRPEDPPRAGYEPLLAERMDHRWMPGAMGIFCAWAAAWLLFRHTPEAIQNVAVYLAFPVTAVTVAATSSRGTADRALQHCIVFSEIFATIGLVSILRPGGHTYGPRSFAILALVMMAALIPHKTPGRWARTLPFVLFALVAMSLSRTATVIAALMLSGLVLRGSVSGRKVRLTGLLIAVVIGLQQLVTRPGKFRDRFIEGDNAVTAGGLKLNTSGRSVIWKATMDDARGHRLTGRGPGSSTDFLIDTFGNISHPHNDYIRIFHDFGLIGIALFAVGYIALIRGALIRARRIQEPIHWAAFLALIAVAAIAFTDNVFVYPFVMIPLGVLVGLSIAYRVPPKAARHPAAARPVYAPDAQRALDAVVARQAARRSLLAATSGSGSDRLS